MADLDLPKYLRIRAERADVDHDHLSSRVYDESAEMLEKLEAEIKRLQAKIPELAGRFLREAASVIKVWHGQEAWEIYWKKSPEMNRLQQIAAELVELAAKEGSE